jgi:hypothetical protein
MDRQGFLGQRVSALQVLSAVLAVSGLVVAGTQRHARAQQTLIKKSEAAGRTADAAAKTTPKNASATEKTPAKPAKTAGKASENAAKPAAREPIERRPYRISFHLQCDPSARIDPANRDELLRQWQVLERRFIGPPWAVAIAPASDPLASLDFETLQPETFSGFSAFDKVWVVRISAAPSEMGLLFTGREYDMAARRLGALQERVVHALGDVPRALLEFTIDLFNPTAEITGQEGGRALLKVQGAAITPASPVGEVVSKGTVFLALRLVSLRDGKLQILRIPYTYLQAESVEGPVAHCTIVSALRDPLTNRVQRPNSLAALGLKAGNTPVRLRFVTRADKLPAAGYTVTVRRVPDGQPYELGITDRSGRIVLRPGFASGLVILRLLAGNVEPMVELPLMPGESADERSIDFDPKPHTVELESQVDSLRDEVVDLVAMRARLEARMKARLDGEDWTGLEAAIKEFALLTPRDEFAQRLAKLKEDAAQRQAQLKKAVLTRTATAQISDLQSMIDRYLDDDTYKAYADALERAKGELAALEKAKAKKAAAQATPAPGATSKDAQQAKAAQGQPKPQTAPAQPKPQPAPGQPKPPPGQPDTLPF